MKTAYKGVPKLVKVVHQFTLFDYNEMLVRGIPKDVKEYLIKKCQEGRVQWKAKDERGMLETLQDMNYALDNLCRRINQKPTKNGRPRTS